MGNLVVAQSGGPTAAINATIVGVLEMVKLSEDIEKVYGAKYGVKGILEEDLIDLDELKRSTKSLELLKQTPAAVLGSCRFKLGKSGSGDMEAQCERIIEVFRKYGITYFVYIGGNDSMDTVYQLHRYCRAKKIDDIRVLGAPKTIDNDLPVTDHCPGFGSAAKYIATTVAELERDISVYDVPAVTIVEIMGRNAGWLTASTAMARVNGGKGPALIYLCEHPFDIDRFVEDVRKKTKEGQGILVAVSEGIRDENGRYISELYQPEPTEKEEAPRDILSMDAFGHGYLAGVGQILAQIVRERIGCKVRAVELNLMQRCASHIASATDIEESRMLGMKAVAVAFEGKSGVMVTLDRQDSEEYTVEYGCVDIAEVANQEKTVPLSWITEDGHDITPEMFEYLYPLIEGERNIRYRHGIPNNVQLI